jgi:hypothetical protein
LTVEAFREVQRFWRNPVALTGVLVVAATVAYAGAATDEPVWPGVVITGAIAALLGVPLVTTVDADAARVRFPPFRGLRLGRGAIASAEAVSYRPIREFGGWGYRIGRNRSRAYTVSGDRGVRLRLADGRDLVVGSRRPDELAAALQHLLPT